jgi:hypothetical protein
MTEIGQGLRARVAAPFEDFLENAGHCPFKLVSRKTELEQRQAAGKAPSAAFFILWHGLSAGVVPNFLKSLARSELTRL